MINLFLSLHAIEIKKSKKIKSTHQIQSYFIAEGDSLVMLALFQVITKIMFEMAWHSNSNLIHSKFTDDL